MSDLIGTVWEIIYDFGDIDHLTFLKNGRHKIIIVKVSDPEDEDTVGSIHDYDDYTWDLNGSSITISTEFSVKNGKINSDFNEMEGQLQVKQEIIGKWTGKRIEGEK